MKKKITIFFMIVFILLLPIMINAFSKVMTPDKILLVGHQISEYEFEFTKEIKDEQKVSEFEQLFEEIVFSTEEWHEETYADTIFQINHKEGIYTHSLKIWIDGEEAIMLKTHDRENKTATIGKLSKSQLENLETIIK
ncbi:hypothetical protein [Lentibacillus saliphilus]|uniref:hypothetical protein n=1 Tax=Lentibacillus saliphilus TaxID=2737028 RepID=UPI001C30105D|nr:hypothetical protein [Lentibacillus saliphilus]